MAIEHNALICLQAWFTTTMCALCAVAHRLGKITGSDEFLEHLHMALFKRKGTSTSRKKDIRTFAGWTFSSDGKV